MVGLDENSTDAVKKVLLDCPLCGQDFQTFEARCSHLKSCGIKFNLSTAQLLSAVRLQEKYVNERLAAGLPNVVKSRLTKPKTSKKQLLLKKRPKSKAEEDLQIGLALSESLKESEKKETEIFEEFSESSLLCNSNEQCKNYNEEKFHVMNIESKHLKTRKRKIKHSGIPALLLRSENERLKLLQDKISSHFTTGIAESYAKIEENISNYVKFKGISKLTVKMTPLWNMSKNESNVLDKFYVLSLKSLIPPSKSQIKSKEFTCQNENISSNKFPTVSSKIFDTNHETNPDVAAALKLVSDFKTLVGNEEGSDVRIIVAKNRIIAAHSIILKVRCPSIIKDLHCNQNQKKFEVNWNDVSYETALAFLEVIYSGSSNIDGINTTQLKGLINRYQVQNLFENFDLERHLNINQSMIDNERQLQNILNSIWKIDNDDDKFKNNEIDDNESQNDEMDDVYEYLSQKQGIEDRNLSLASDSKPNFFETSATNQEESQKDKKCHHFGLEKLEKTTEHSLNKTILFDNSMDEYNENLDMETEHSLNKTILIDNSMEKCNVDVLRTENNEIHMINENKSEDLNFSLKLSHSSSDASEELFTEDIHDFQDSDRQSKMRSYIQKDKELYQDILEYKPFPVSELHKKMKSAGIKISLQCLMDYLDEECIIYTLPKGRNVKEKQLQRSKRYKSRVKGRLAKRKSK
ncbi:structure-specific endonuclease subunit SLX4-like [Centruroides sculpturatus]|uniref:structure-specific endonuclease subunit SLX4-like n=1 Tax=Centruroides sculpturatus TaxID=218467 RepID=UPI000C6D06C8|nr:structure-specific endonuclease subunit SLX4-like [Centruroides sculpturatus]XP_023223968.1 structure-specific endonuclease subunit SLX4-like [Centruroides sculpturatus]